MEKLKKATKRIAAVGAASLVVATTAFGAGLSNYPTNFVEDGEFVGKVVVGSGVGADDTTAANSVIEDLRAEFSGETEKVVITYRDASDGDSVSATDDRDTLNFGVTNFTDVKEVLDLDSTSVLEDGDLDNNDYSQELAMGNLAEFNYRLFDEVDKEEATDGLYFDNGATFATYTLDFDTALTSADRNDSIGETLIIMGNEFNVIEMTADTMTLIGGSNKVSLGEGESTKITIDGKSYDISIQSVADEKVLLTVNGQSKSIDVDQVEDIAGISIAATDLVSSSRDAVKGYAEIVVGGQKIEIEASENIKINDEDLDDVYPNYEITGDWNSDSLVITYAIDDEVLLEAGDFLEDVLFDAFTLSYDGINDVDYSELVIDSDSDSISFTGNLYNGDAIPAEFALSLDDETDNDNFQLGTEDERIFFSGSNNATVDLTNNLGGTIVGLTNTANTTLTFDLNDSALDIKDQLFFTQETDAADMHLFQITSHTDDGADSEISIDDLIGGSTYADRKADDLADDLESDTFANTTLTEVEVVLADLSEDNGEDDTTAAQLYLENELIMNFQEAENKSGTGYLIQFKYSSDADADEAVTLDNVINLSYAQKATDYDTDAIVLSVDGNLKAHDRFEVEEDSDLEMFVDAYGTRVTIDTDNNDMVKIEVPDEEVYGTISFNFGDAGSTSTKTVDAADLDDAKAELEDDGYTIVSTETLAAEEVEFDIDGVTLDTDVADMENLIVVGGPAVNAVARDLLGIEMYTIDQAGVDEGEGVVKYFADSNSVLVYGYSKADTAAAVARLNAGGLSGDEERVE